MRNVKGTLKTWGSVVKDSIVAYIRTFSITWQNGALALLGVLLLTLLLGVVPAAQFFVTERLINAITAAIGDADWWQQVVPWLIGLIGLQTLNISVDLLREPLRLHVGANIEAWINENIVRKSNTIELTEFQTPEFQNALARARAMSGIELDEIVWWIFDSLQQLISAVTLGIVLWRYHPLLALLPMITGFASWWSGSRFAASVYNLDVEQTPQRRERDALEGILTDRGAGKEIRLYQAQDLWITRWRKLWTALIDEQQAIERRKFFAHLTIDIARGLLYACSLIFLLLEVFRGGLTVGTYIAAAAALVQLDGIWNEVTSHFQWIGNEMRRLSGDLYPFLDRGSDTLKANTGDVAASESHVNSFQPLEEPPYLRIENVSFLYPNTQVPVLNHINVTLRKGERVALVGPNGAGKTTLARVISGALPSTERHNLYRRCPLKRRKSPRVVDALQCRVSGLHQLPSHCTRKYYLRRPRTSRTHGNGINRWWCRFGYCRTHRRLRDDIGSHLWGTRPLGWRMAASRHSPKFHAGNTMARCP